MLINAKGIKKILIHTSGLYKKLENYGLKDDLGSFVYIQKNSFSIPNQILKTAYLGIFSTFPKSFCLYAKKSSPHTLNFFKSLVWETNFSAYRQSIHYVNFK